ncbi:DUF3488 and transglutaminase-like domain-containing protein, partial [Bacteriovoracaceae bacterium]|nr:DUF3488 and transglutaminase-like domain-containing protein [Bacteriovoracaceae bacterium]
IMIISFFGEFRALETGVALLLIFSIVKMFELNNIRDYYLFLVINLLMVVAQLLTVYSLSILVYAFAYCVFLYLFINYIKSENDKKEIKAQRNKALREIFYWSIPVSVIFFLVFPRLLIGNIFFNTVKQKNKTGFANELNPGSLSKVINDPTPVFRASFLSEKKVTVPLMYWRGGVLESTDGFNWRPGPISRITMRRKKRSKAKIKYRIDFENFQSSTLFLLKNTFQVDMLSRGYLKRGVADNFEVRVLSNQKIKYQGVVSNGEALKLSSKKRKRLTQIPQRIKDSQFYQWATSLKENKINEVIGRYQEYLGENKFTYTLSPGLMNRDSPLDDFFFNKRTGLCEHFASSLAMLLRIKKIPTRIVVGFHGGIYNNLSDYFIIRNEDAHAWLEYWEDAKGWSRVDPTSFVAPDRLSFGAFTFNQLEELGEGEDMEAFFKRQNSSIVQEIRFAIDMIYYRLNNSFINYDFDSQKDFFQKFKFFQKNMRGKLIFLLIAFIVAVSFALTYFVKNTSSKVNRAHAIYQKLCRKLSKKYGLTVKPARNPNIVFNNLLKHDKFSFDTVKLWEEFALNYNDILFNTRRDKNKDKDKLKRLKLILKALT